MLRWGYLSALGADAASHSNKLIFESSGSSLQVCAHAAAGLLVRASCAFVPAGDVQREHDVSRLCVHVIKGDSLWGSAGGRPGDTQAHVTVFQRDGVISFKTTSRVVRGQAAPDWQLVSVIDIADEDPLDCCISLQVKKLPPFNLGFRRTICAYYAPLRSLLSQARSSARGSARIPPNEVPFARLVSGAWLVHRYVDVWNGTGCETLIRCAACQLLTYGLLSIPTCSL